VGSDPELEKAPKNKQSLGGGLAYLGASSGEEIEIEPLTSKEFTPQPDTGTEQMRQLGGGERNRRAVGG